MVKLREGDCMKAVDFINRLPISHPYGGLSKHVIRQILKKCNQWATISSISVASKLNLGGMQIAIDKFKQRYMKIAENILGGFAGSVVLNIAHQAIARFDKDAPRIDVIGEEAVSRVFQNADAEPPTGNTLTGLTLTSDLGANTGYYAMIGGANNQDLLLRGAGYGLLAGIGALSLPAPMGLNDEPVTRTTKTKILTVGLYILGGLATALTIKAIRGYTNQ